MSLTREQATIQNQQKIDNFLRSEGIISTAANTQTQIQTSLSHQGLSDKTVLAQQKLSEEFGIPTFDISGQISTVPLTTPIDFSINVGTGAFTESAFRESLQVLQNEQAIETTFTGTFNDFFLKPIIDFVNQVFPPILIEELTPEQQAIINRIDEDITSLKSRFVTVPGISFGTRCFGSGIRRTCYQYQSNGAAIREAKAHNSLIQQQINDLRAEREEMLRDFAAIVPVTDAIKTITAEIDEFLAMPGLTAKMKADLNVKIQEASKLIEEIIKNVIQIEQSELTKLQVAMQAAAFKLQEPATVTTNIIDTSLGFLEEMFFGVGATISKAFTGIGEQLRSALLTLILPPPEIIVQMARNQVEAAKTLLTEQNIGVDVEAFNVEKVQREIAGEE